MIPRTMRDSVVDLLNRLENLIQRQSRLPHTNRRVTAQWEQALGMVHMVKAALPGELREAAGLRSEAEHLLRSAQDEARRVVLEAQATARQRIEDHVFLREATQRVEEELSRAQRDAQSVREGADAYASGVLADLESSVTRILEAIRRGRALLKEAAGSAYNEQSGSGR